MINLELSDFDGAYLVHILQMTLDEYAGSPKGEKILQEILQKLTSDSLTYAMIPES